MAIPLPPESEDRPQGGFGAPIRKPKEPEPEWRPVEGSKDIWKNKEGQLKTEIPLGRPYSLIEPDLDSLEEAIREWVKAYNADTEQDFLP